MPNQVNEGLKLENIISSEKNDKLRHIFQIANNIKKLFDADIKLGMKQTDSNVEQYM